MRTVLCFWRSHPRKKKMKPFRFEMISSYNDQTNFLSLLLHIYRNTSRWLVNTMQLHGLVNTSHIQFCLFSSRVQYSEKTYLFSYFTLSLLCRKWPKTCEKVFLSRTCLIIKGYPPTGNLPSTLDHILTNWRPTIALTIHEEVSHPQ